MVPSQTELLSDLGLDKQIIGITKFCVHPLYLFDSVTRVGGTKNLNIQKIKSLNPDLVIANKEENSKEQIEEIAEFTDVYVSNVSDFSDALIMIEAIGQLTGSKNKARRLIKLIHRKKDELQANQQDMQPLKSIYLIWEKPYMTIGGDTFISNMMKLSGFENVFASQARYPEVTLTEIVQMAPDVLLLSSEPYPFKEKHVTFFSQHMPSTKVIVVDGEMFSWYGSRMTKALPYLDNLRGRISYTML